MNYWEYSRDKKTSIIVMASKKLQIGQWGLFKRKLRNNAHLRIIKKKDF